MNKRFFLILLGSFFILFEFFAQNIVLSGYLYDKNSGEPLLFATCVDTLSHKGTTTSHLGYFNMRLPKGKVAIATSFMGYESIVSSFTLHRDTSIVIYLSPKFNELKEVIVSSAVPMHQQVLMGKNTMTIEQIKSIPSFVGISDLMKAITMLPGVTSGKEGYSNIYVRGGDRGQNLILMDGIKLYNTNHVGGFLSLFNPEIIKQVDLYKGGFPSRYGGRASSVIDIYTKEGNKQELKGSFNIGLLTSGFLIEAPLSEKVNYWIAARTSYYDLFTLSSQREYKATGRGTFMRYTIFDINGKINWRVSNKNRLSLSFYSGEDIQKNVEAVEASEQKIDEINNLKIQNHGISLTHHTVIMPNLLWKNNIAYSYYGNLFSSQEERYEYGSLIKTKNSTSSQIKDLSFQSRVEYFPNEVHAIKSGVEVSYYQFNPGIQSAYFDHENSKVVNDTVIGLSNHYNSVESSFYLEDELSIGNYTKLNLGLRGTSYFGGDTTFLRLEPRISFRVLLSDRYSFKANYTIMNQYNHVMVNNYLGFEKEIWVAATKKMVPQRAEQFSGGIFYSNTSAKMDIAIEGFYKDMSHLLEYKGPTSELDILEDLENLITTNGKGVAYGAEFLLKKEFGQLTTNLNYTLSWNFRQFEQLNNGAWYPFIYDKRHDLSVLALWKLSDRYSISNHFSLASGAPVTLPLGYSKDDAIAYGYFIYGEIHNRRLPLYHRLDVAISRKEKTNRGNLREVSLNVFNIYARQNPVYVYYNSSDGKVYQKSLFSILPTVSFAYRF